MSDGPNVPASARSSPRLTLTGVRILDLTQVAIGPYATLLLAGLGAEVVKVESNRRPDTSRGPAKPATPMQLRQYPDSEPGERPYNRTALYNQRNRSKLGITIDLSHPDGKALLLQLACVCDALVENYRASVLERQGLGWPVLHELNPRLVYLKMSSQGDTGPEREYGSIGATLEQTAGLASVTGYPDGPPMTSSLVYPDPLGGVLGVGALIAGLRRARQTGDGMLIDLSQREMTVSMLTEAMMDYALNGRVQGPAGNRHPTAAPHGVYPCRPEEPAAAAGRAALQSPDSWIAIAVETDAQWQALREAIGQPEWAADPRFTTAEGRHADQATIDAHLARWTAGIEHRELMIRLQGAGVPAGAVLTGVELLDDPQLAARDWWQHVTPTEIGRSFPFVGAPWRLSASPTAPSRPAPTLGEHNERISLDLLGLSRERYARLQSDGVVSIEPLW